MRVVRSVCAVVIAVVATTAGVTLASVPPGTEPSTPVESVVPEEETNLGPDITSPFQEPALIAATPAVSGPLIVVPPGCAAPAAALAVFVGVVIARDPTTARFQIEALKVGSVDGYAVGRLIDVKYGDDVRFLSNGRRYIVGAGTDREAGTLFSKVRQPAPLFGGDAVIGANDSDVVCPQVEDPVRTLNSDGTTVDSALLAPLRRAKVSILSAIVRPLAVGFVVLLCLVVLKLLLFAGARSLRGLADRDVEPVARERRHHST